MDNSVLASLAVIGVIGVIVAMIWKNNSRKSSGDQFPRDDRDKKSQR